MEQFAGLNFGLSLAGVYTPIQVDSAGRQIVAAKAGDKVISIETGFASRVSSTNLSAGSNSFNHTAVPTGKIWHLENITMFYIGTVAGVVLETYFARGGVGYYLMRVTPVVSGQWYTLPVSLFMMAAELIVFNVNGATAGDDAYCDILGYQQNA